MKHISFLNPLKVVLFCFLFFFFSLGLCQQVNLPVKIVISVGWDGACPSCSGSQVWADNCQVCAAETDDYRLYCLSQAQSNLIQQSHLILIYESLSVPHSPTLYSIPLSYAYSKLTLMSLLAECPPAATAFLCQVPLCVRVCVCAAGSFQ